MIVYKGCKRGCISEGYWYNQNGEAQENPYDNSMPYDNRDKNLISVCGSLEEVLKYLPFGMVENYAMIEVAEKYLTPMKDCVSEYFLANKRHCKLIKNISVEELIQ